jgi:hypothetical protein
LIDKRNLNSDHPASSKHAGSESLSLWIAGHRRDETEIASWRRNELADSLVQSFSQLGKLALVPSIYASPRRFDLDVLAPNSRDHIAQTGP